MQLRPKLRWILLGILVIGIYATVMTIRFPSYPHQMVGDSQLRKLPHSANGRDYLLYVSLPYSYRKEPNKRYPVLYHCDGYWIFTLFNALYSGLIYDKAVPEFIIVGIGYQGNKPDYATLRSYDYTNIRGPQDRAGNFTGHADEFLSVVQKEIIPFVEREYRADPSYRVLAGSSAGGIFTLYTMFTKPELFQAYIAVSPATMWVDTLEQEYAQSRRPLNARLFMSGAGEEWPGYLATIQRFNDRLRSRHYPGFDYEWRLIDGEGHGGTAPESFNRGLRFAFAPITPKREPLPAFPTK